MARLNNFEKNFTSNRTNVEIKIPIVVTNKTDNELDWGDLVYRYFADVDAVKLYFIKVVPNMIQDSEKITPNIVGDFDSEGRLVALEILNTTHLLACHFFETTETIQSKRPLLLHTSYDKKSDICAVYFTDPNCSKLERLSEAPSIVQGLSADSKIEVLYFLDASKTLRKAPKENKF